MFKPNVPKILAILRPKSYHTDQLNFKFEYDGNLNARHSLAS